MTCGAAVHCSISYMPRKKPLLDSAGYKIVPEPLSGCRVGARQTALRMPHATAPHVWQTYLGPKGQGSHLVTAMSKATGNDLLARFPEPHLLVAVLPASEPASEKESIFNAQ